MDETRSPDEAEEVKDIVPDTEPALVTEDTKMESNEAAEVKEEPIAGDVAQEPEESKADADTTASGDTFVNHGFLKWQDNRRKWLERNEGDNVTAKAKPLDVDDIIDIIFASPKQWREQSGPQKFPVNVPLPQMVDILQDLWEAEGLEV